MKRMIVVIVSLLILALGVTGCAQNTAAKNSDKSGKISIVTTIFPVYDFARAIGGDQAELTMLVKPAAEVHSYDPSPADIIKIQDADVFIYIGGENDAWVSTILDSMDTRNKKIIRLMDAVKPVAEETVEGMEAEPAEAEIEYDEHIWTSPKNAILMINEIAAALAEIDAQNADAYTKNAADYTAQIQAVDDEITKIVAASPNKLLVFGDRFPFRYFVDEFGLEYKAAFPGCSTDTEASAGTLAYLMNTIKEKNIKYVYYIELSNQNIARAISEQTGAQLLQLHSAHNVTKDDFDAGATYVSIMQQNVENLRKGLANQ
ncbi:metal ABC transporter substrate-binding protein [Acetobacterium sp.]|jgi:zinc transport system substrate-binding protein|uniref:metal ABC transporter substrate-binding protein n=1 Tax=Acetobacterium sp. TaxID=1872094 RepID=UPI000CB8C9FE|nr:metal ABC transporter substrate-binding protein [Acetobacterium sp.]MDO9492371.1 metal ABC transporter substrate-binding protein [Acetobacterium sp.]PKM74847.1 MAG: zinc ABC transporter substrate-binding protein [Firmicutes bacterium HGW-Firmicutes-17]